MEALPAGTAQSGRPDGDRLLLRLRSRGGDPAGGSRGGGAALEHREWLRAGQAGGRAGRVRGTAVGRLAPLHHAWLAGPRLSGGAAGAGPRRKRGSSVKATEGSAAGLEDELVPLSVAEVRRLFRNVLLRSAAPVDHVLDWSRWRRRHQARARYFHYRRRARRKQTNAQL